MQEKKSSTKIHAKASYEAGDQAEPVAWANWKVGSDSYVIYRTRLQAEVSVRHSEIASPQEGPYEVVPLSPSAPRANSTDALDAQRWRDHIGKLDALVTYCPTCCQGFTAKPEMTRDEVIFECGKTAGRSAAMTKEGK